jgi:hypothetical protein
VEAKYSANFDASCGPIPRNTLLLHLLQYLTHVKNEYDHLPENSKNLKIENLKDIRAEDSSEHIFHSAS